MECVEAAALKTSFRKELPLVSFQQEAFFDDLLPVNVLNLQNGVSSEDFSVDELLDFSNQEELEEDEDEEEELEVEEKGHQENNEKSIHFTPTKDDFPPLPTTSDLSLPTDDLASLEWLSHFVEDSNSEYATPFPAGVLLPKEEGGNRTEPEKKGPFCSETLFKTPFPAKARSKRTRAGTRAWPLGTPPSESSSSSTTTSSTSSSSPYQASGCWLTCPAEPVKRLKPASKKKKGNRTEVEENGPPKLVGGRRCSHCGVQKTPQWRTGPLGTKTLCNACGVRFKSGRLLPEYRPACSPTFSSELHSNSHRKVLEMRRKKESLDGQLEQTGLKPNPNPLSVGDVIPSFG